MERKKKGEKGGWKRVDQRERERERENVTKQGRKRKRWKE